MHHIHIGLIWRLGKTGSERLGKRRINNDDQNNWNKRKSKRVWYSESQMKKVYQEGGNEGKD